MLEVKHNLERHYTEFKCPLCGADDAIYTTRDNTCYMCGNVYEFNVELLIENRDERELFFNYGNTSTW